MNDDQADRRAYLIATLIAVACFVFVFKTHLSAERQAAEIKRAKHVLGLETKTNLKGTNQ